MKFELPSQFQQILVKEPYSLLFATISGAHLYGFPSADSDYDLRGAHILPLKGVIGLQTGPETREISLNQEGIELDLVTHDVKKFMGLLLKRNGYVLEQLYSPLIVVSSPEHDALKAIATRCITRHHSHHYLGFAQTQWRLFTKESPARVKPLLYVFRVLLTGIHLMQTGEIEANLRHLNEKFQLTYIPDLIAQKTSGPEQALITAHDQAFYQSEYHRLLQTLEHASQSSLLPDNPSAAADLHQLLINIRLAAD